jgi:hypothetical protein
MSNLLPDVSLDEETQDEDSDQERGDTQEELQNYTSKEKKNYSSKKPPEGQGGRESQEGNKDVEDSANGNSSSSGASEVSVIPEERPELRQKLGPYISTSVNEALEEVYLKLRREFGSDASKSLIVEAALRYFLSDHMRHGDKSEVSEWMRRVLDAE